jgi:hypothetical protein
LIASAAFEIEVTSAGFVPEVMAVAKKIQEMIWCGVMGWGFANNFA